MHASRITLDQSWREQLVVAGIFQKFSPPGPHVVYEGKTAGHPTPNQRGGYNLSTLNRLLGVLNGLLGD
jgi:hypothetical protein